MTTKQLGCCGMKSLKKSSAKFDKYYWFMAGAYTAIASIALVMVIAQIIAENATK